MVRLIYVIIYYNMVVYFVCQLSLFGESQMFWFHVTVFLRYLKSPLTIISIESVMNAEDSIAKVTKIDETDKSNVIRIFSIAQ